VLSMLNDGHVAAYVRVQMVHLLSLDGSRLKTGSELFLAHFSYSLLHPHDFSQGFYTKTLIHGNPRVRSQI